MKKTLSLLLLVSLVLSLASCGQKTTTDDPVAAATLAESYQSYLDTAEPSYAYDIALELTTNPEYFNAEQGGRNAGSDAEHAAADYLVGVMKDIGLADVEKQAAQCDRWQFNSASLTIDGKDYLLMQPIHADFALLGAYKCDEFGNCWYKGTMRNFNVVMATAADTVIAECEYIVPVGDFEPENIHTYGMCVDYIVEGDRK